MGLDDSQHNPFFSTVDPIVKVVRLEKKMDKSTQDGNPDMCRTKEAEGGGATSNFDQWKSPHGSRIFYRRREFQPQVDTKYLLNTTHQKFMM